MKAPAVSSEMVVSPHRAARSLRRSLGLLGLFIVAGVPIVSATNPTLSVSVNMTSSNGAAKSAHFAGISIGTTSLISQGTQGYKFDTNTTQSPQSNEMITLCQNMGLSHIRIGGTSVDYKVPLTDYDYTGIDAFFDFNNAIGSRVIYSLRAVNSASGTNYQTIDAQIAGHIWGNGTYQALLDSFSIGNEPSFYASNPVGHLGFTPSPAIGGYSDYRNIWKAKAAAVVTATSSSVGFAAADAQDGSNWTGQIINDRHNGVITQHIFNATQHFYVGGSVLDLTNSATNATNAATNAIKKMLGNTWNTTDYPNWITAYPNSSNWHGWSYRITEADECYGTADNTDGKRGVTGASNAFAGAMYALDFLCTFAKQDLCKGVNFHNTWGSRTDTVDYDGSHYFANPRWAALKMFGFMYNGSTDSKSTTWSTSPSGVNVRVYGAGDSTNMWALVINKTNDVTGDGTGVDATVGPSNFTAHNAEYIKMSSYPTTNDPRQLQATLGGSTNTYNTTWSGTWNSLSVSSNTCSVTVGRCTAILVHMW